MEDAQIVEMGVNPLLSFPKLTPIEFGGANTEGEGKKTSLRLTHSPHASFPEVSSRNQNEVEWDYGVDGGEIARRHNTASRLIRYFIRNRYAKIRITRKHTRQSLCLECKLYHY